MIGNTFQEKTDVFNSSDKVVHDLEIQERFKSNNQTVIDDATYAKGVVSVLVTEEERIELLKKEKEAADKKAAELKALEEQMNNIDGQ